MSKQVFISYSSEDRESAERICELLEDQGIECWIAPRDIPPGKKWGEAIVTAIENTTIMVLLLSEKANVSDYVEREVQQAASERKTVIPFRIQGVEPSKALKLFISSHQWIDAWIPPLEERVKVLADAIRNLLGIPPEPPPPPPPPPPPEKKEVFATTKEEIELIACPKSSIDKPIEEITEEMKGKREGYRPPPEMVSDPEVRAAVEKAIWGIKIIGSGSGYSDKNSEVVWRQLHATYKGQEIVELCFILEDPLFRGDETYSEGGYWKVITLLKYGLRTPEGRKLASQILNTIGNNMKESESSQRVAIETITQAPVLPEEKWAPMFAFLLNPGLKLIGEAISAFKNFTPIEKRKETCDKVFDILISKLNNSSIVGCAIELLITMGYRRPDTSKISEMLCTADLEVAAKLAQWIFSDLRDKEVGPAIRKAIKNWCYGENASSIMVLLRCLYALEGSACTGYIGEVLRDASPEAQKSLMKSLWYLGEGAKESAILDAVRKLAETTDDPDTKKAAEEFLADVS